MPRKTRRRRTSRRWAGDQPGASGSQLISTAAKSVAKTRAERAIARDAEVYHEVI
jgi:hypothetical protein